MSAALSCLVSGCTWGIGGSSNTPIRPLLSLAGKRSDEVRKNRTSDPISILVDGQTLGSFARQISRDYGVSLVIEERLEDKRVSLDVSDVPIDRVLGMVARRVGAELTINGDLYYVGNLQPEDRGVFCSRVTVMLPADVDTMIGALLSTDGDVFVDGRGVCVVADKIGVINRVHEVIGMVESMERDVWVCQFHLVTVRRADINDFGIESSLSGVVNSSGKSSEVQFSAVMDSTGTRGSSKVVSEPVFLTNDGEKVTFDMGSEVPIVTSSIDAQSGRLSENLTFKRVGLSLESTITGTGQDNGTLSYTLRDDRVARYNNDGPVITGANVTGRVDVVSGGTYLLASYTANDVTDLVSFWDRWGLLGRDVSEVTQLWLRVARVSAAESGLSEGGEIFEDQVTRIRPESERPSQWPELRHEDEKAVDVSDESVNLLDDLLQSP